MLNVRRAQELLAAAPAGWMETLGARITESEPGRVVLELEAGPQHRHGGGVVQGGVITQIADAAMGMSLATLQENGMWNTTIELKINFLRPVVTGRIRAIGRVVDLKQTLLFSEADVLDDQGRLVARASSTCLAVPEGQGRE
ncbi:MAG: PaaI family thioesterase [Candidatus Dormibacteraeota bacterium]|nr:PaaI family thioesterase [Candidatus Dormibacteraeota bacterium]